MRKGLLLLVATLTACLSLLAGTNMCVRLEDGQIVKFDVNRVLEVYYEAYIHPDTNHIVPPFIDPSIADTSAYAPLRFEITSDSTVELTPGDSWDSYRSLDSVNIPAKVRIDGKIYDVTSIGNEAFADCDLFFIDIPESVTTIGNYAFAYCGSLTSIVIPESVTTIGDRAFFKCDLTSIVLPESVTTIGNEAFAGCRNLESIVIPESVTTIGNYAFAYCGSLTSIVIPESVTTIGDEAFYECYSLTPGLLIYDKGTKSYGWVGSKDSCVNVVIPESVITIGDSTFAYCGNLKSIVIPEGVTSIGDCAFSGCISLSSIVIPEGVTSIGHDAFSTCRSLTSIVIPESVTSIGERAFSWCENLDIEIENTEENVKFMGWNGQETTMEGSEAFKGVKSVTWKKDMDSSSVADTSAYAPLRFQITSDSTVELTSEYSYRSLDSVNIPAKVRIDGKIYDVTSIGDEAFYGCGNLESVDIPEGVTSIGDRAFSKCGLTSIVLPNSVTGIGNEAFAGSGLLTSINIPESVTTIGNGAFGGCGNLTSIVIPESVTTIGERAFVWCENLDIEIENTEENVKFMGWNGQETTMEGSEAFKGVKSVTWKK